MRAVTAPLSLRLLASLVISSAAREPCEVRIITPVVHLVAVPSPTGLPGLWLSRAVARARTKKENTLPQITNTKGGRHLERSTVRITDSSDDYFSLFKFFIV